MTGHGDIAMSVKAMKAGAVDFLAKPFRDQDMLDAVASALARDRARLAAEHSGAVLCRAYQTLTAREREVLGFVIAGLMNKQIAGQLNLSEVTVKVHRGQVMRKMAARSVADLVRIAEALGIEPVQRNPERWRRATHRAAKNLSSVDADGQQKTDFVGRRRAGAVP